MENCRGIAIEHILEVVTSFRGFVCVEHILGKRNLSYRILAIFPLLVLHLYILHHIVSRVGDSIFYRSIETVACLLAHLLFLANVCNRPVVAQLETCSEAFSNRVYIEAHIFGYIFGFNVHIQVRVVFVVEFVRSHIGQLGNIGSVLAVCSLLVLYSPARLERNGECAPACCIVAAHRLERVGIYATVGKSNEEAFGIIYIYGSIIHITVKILVKVLAVVAAVARVAAVAACHSISIVCCTGGSYCNCGWIDILVACSVREAE